MFRKSPQIKPPPEPKPTANPSKSAPRVEVDKGLHSSQAATERALKISDIDFSDPSEPRVLFEESWQPLKLYRTKATLTLTDFTFKGGWLPRLSKTQNDEQQWHESLSCTASIGLNYRGPCFSFFDGGERREQSDRSRYLVYETKFRETTIHADKEWELHKSLAAEKRQNESRYNGSPIALFKSANDADKFLREEILCYGEDFAFLYPDEIAKRGELPQQYRFPELYFSNAEYRTYDDKYCGLYGSGIALPPDVYNGFRRALTDFREGLVVKMQVWLELYGIDPKEDYGTTDGYYATLTLIPHRAQLSGKIDGVSLEWGQYAKPFHSISSDQPDL